MKKLSLLALATAFSLTSFANTPIPNKSDISQMSPPALNIKATSWVLMSYQSGQVIASKNMNEQLPPASLTKLMTSYIASQAIEAGQVKLNAPVHISVKAWKTPGSRTFVREGTKVSFENLMKGMIVQSGNDATVAIAEYLGGSPEAFARQMNQTASALGMKNSHFMNASGLPAKNQYSSAYDIALLSRALISHFPKEYDWYKIKSFSYNGIKQYNRNRLLWDGVQVDGLKTGYTKEAKYCLAASAERNGKRYIAVVMGADSPKIRTREAETMLSYGFQFFDTKQLYAANQTLESLTLPKTAGNKLEVTIKKAVAVTIPKGHENQLKAHLEVQPNLKTPVKAGTKIGQLVVSYGNNTLTTQPLYAKNSIKKAGFFQRMTHQVKSIFTGTSEAKKS